MNYASLALLLTPLALAACASERPAPSQRGWIGGRLVDVSRQTRHWEAEMPPIESDGTVIGMPSTVEGDSAALVTAAEEGTPLARAGLAPGDLVIRLDGTPVAGAKDLRRRIEGLAPGAHADVTYWRAGTVASAPIVIGRETFESAGTIEAGIRLSPVIDIWPFDDGINLLGLVRVGWDDRRYDVSGAEAAYLRQAAANAPIVGPRQEVTEVFVLPLGVSKGKRVLSQETLP